MGKILEKPKTAPVEKLKLESGDELAVSTVDEKEVSKTRKKRMVTPDRCPVCESNTPIDYKDVYRLKRFMSRRGRMIPRSRSGACAKHQRQIATAIKRARQMAMLPYVSDE